MALVSVAKPVQNLWDSQRAQGMSELEKLSYRSNLLGTNRSIANYGGGNTSTKAVELDHVGREQRVMFVKGSGTDLRTITASQFTGLRLDEIDPLYLRDEMSDEAMVAYLARCQTRPDMPRSSIETLLHAFIPFDHVDHTHPDATNMICCAENGEQMTKELYGDVAAWIPYIRPGFTLSKQVGEAVRNNRNLELVLLAKHGLVTWGESHEECYRSTLEAIGRAVEFVNERARGRTVFGGIRFRPLEEDRRRDLLASVLPVVRGELSTHAPAIVRVDSGPSALQFISAAASKELSQVGAACPDHLIHTKMRPLWVDFDPEVEGAEDLAARVAEGIAGFRRDYEDYFKRNFAANREADERMMDPNPRVVLVPGVGVLTAGSDLAYARLSSDLYHRAIEVMRGASTIDSFVSLDETESYAVEYWPLERYKLTLRPPPPELTGKVVLVTGGAGGIGSAVARRLSQLGANVVVADVDIEGAQRVLGELELDGIAVSMDVTDEASVAQGFRDAVLAYGGVDIVVSNAGLASAAPVEDTTVDQWERDHSVLARGYFLVAREAFRLMRRQGLGGSIVFVGSKNGLVASRNASAYGAAKAAELHLARCLADEGGAHGIRVNTVNPDAVLQGSKIWEGQWRAERARAYGIEPDQLEEHYRERTVLRVNVLPEDVAEAVLFFASPARSPKSTGNILNVDGGISAAYTR
jgi:rhamnulose-1-phosphate aldolase/alcohol dehydrogenase